MIPIGKTWEIFVTIKDFDGSEVLGHILTSERLSIVMGETHEVVTEGKRVCKLTSLFEYIW